MPDRLLGILGAVCASLVLAAVLQTQAIPLIALGLIGGLVLAAAHDLLDRNVLLAILFGGVLSTIGAATLAYFLQPEALTEDSLRQTFFVGAALGFSYWLPTYFWGGKAKPVEPIDNSEPLKDRIAKALKRGEEDAQDAKLQREKAEAEALAAQAANAPARAAEILAQVPEILRRTMQIIVARGEKYRDVEVMILHHLESEQTPSSSEEPTQEKLRFAAKKVWSELEAAGVKPMLALQKGQSFRGGAIHTPDCFCIQIRVYPGMFAS